MKIFIPFHVLYMTAEFIPIHLWIKHHYSHLLLFCIFHTFIINNNQ